jgi:hypothetical protein
MELNFLGCMINVGGDIVWMIYWNYCLKFELLSHGNDFKVWEKQNLARSYQDV